MTKRISLYSSLRLSTRAREREKERFDSRPITAHCKSCAFFVSSPRIRSPLFESTAVVYRSPIHDSLANRDRCRNRRGNARIENRGWNPWNLDGRKERLWCWFLLSSGTRHSRKRDAVATWYGGGGRIPREVEFIECYGNNRTFVRYPPISDL